MLQRLNNVKGGARGGTPGRYTIKIIAQNQ
jgi:hypothetical protein